MPYTIALVATILGYTWVGDPLLEIRGPWRLLPVVFGIALCVAHNRRSRDWGFSVRAFLPALWWSIVLTIPVAAALWLIGHATGPAPIRRGLLFDFLYVLAWGGAQQFALQTVVFSEARRVSGRGAVFLAAVIFACLHLPNPFLTIVTLIGGLLWCWIYSRHPNIVPLALSHAATTVLILVSFDPDTTGGLRTGWHYFQ